MKSDIDIKLDVFDHIQGSELQQTVTGVVRHTGKRPHNSDKEDIIITMLANENGQIQTATVNVNIYVAANIVDGQPEEQTLRLQELCQLSADLFEVFGGKDYRARLVNQRVFEVQGAKEYIINNRIEYKQSNE